MRLIDVDLAIDHCKKYLGTLNPDGPDSKQYAEVSGIVAFLEQLPTAEPKRAKWFKAYGDYEMFGVRPFYRYCSNCGESTVWPYNYCPHCGVRMGGKEDG